MDKSFIGSKEELEDIELDLLLEGIFRHYGFDFRNYRKGTLKRRIKHRMMIENLDSISNLQSLILHKQNMMTTLLNDLSISVTEMFRDPALFLTIRNDIVPYLKKIPEIRIWCAGCSTGEEVYSLAILLYEEGLYEKTTIYASDMNEQILHIAKKGKIPIENMQKYTKNYHHAGGSHEFSEYYYVKQNYAFFYPWLKENIVFAHHNLATDHSFNEFHVILCRNVLIYFNEVLKNRVYQLFYESLTNNGFLILGSKESVVSNKANSHRFELMRIKEKIYQKS